MTSYHTAEEFLSASEKLAYRRLQAIAKELDITPRNVKRHILIQSISTELKRRSSLKVEPRETKTKVRKIPIVAKPIETKNISVKALTKRFDVARRSKSRNGTTQRVSPNIKATGVQKAQILRSKSPLKVKPQEVVQQSNNVVKLRLSIQKAFTTGNHEMFGTEIFGKGYSVSDLEDAIDTLLLKEVSPYAPFIYAPLRRAFPSMLVGTNDKLSRKLFEAAILQDSTTLLKLARREATRVLWDSTNFWQTMVVKTMESASQCLFEAVVRNGFLEMDRYKGAIGRRNAIRIIIDSIINSGVDEEVKRYHHFLLEEMILNEELVYVTIEELNVLTSALYK